jgi:hypothetical protein
MKKYETAIEIERRNTGTDLKKEEIIDMYCPEDFNIKNKIDSETYEYGTTNESENVGNKLIKQGCRGISCEECWSEETEFCQDCKEFDVKAAFEKIGGGCAKGNSTNEPGEVIVCDYYCREKKEVKNNG